MSSVFNFLFHQYNRNRHVNAQHNPNFLGFKCNCCRKTFTRKSQLSIHKRGRCHGSIPSGEESVVTTCQHAYLPCHKCYGFYSRQTLYQHTACCGKSKLVVETSTIVAERHLLLRLLPERNTQKKLMAELLSGLKEAADNPG